MFLNLGLTSLFKRLLQRKQIITYFFQILNIFSAMDEGIVIPNSPYSLDFTTQLVERLPTFQLGEPITFEFTCSKKSVLPNDWVGIYPIDANLHSDVTSSSSEEKWIFVTAHRDKSAVGEDKFVEKSISSGMIGENEVSIIKDGNSSLVKGKLTFSGMLLPWNLGVYEARFHYAGKYNVLACTRPFQIVCDVFKSSLTSEKGKLKEILVDAAGKEDEIRKIQEILLKVVERALELSGVVFKNDEWVPLKVDDIILENFRLRIGSVDASKP